MMKYTIGFKSGRVIEVEAVNGFAKQLHGVAKEIGGFVPTQFVWYEDGELLMNWAEVEFVFPSVRVTRK